jgi:regulator of RNase E activity RraA
MRDQGSVPTTASCADACVQLGVELRVAPVGLRPIDPRWRITGPAKAVLHLGSVGVFLEACDDLRPGEVLLVDDGGRTDRACIGDLTALEVKGAGRFTYDAEVRPQAPRLDLRLRSRGRPEEPTSAPS